MGRAEEARREGDGGAVTAEERVEQWRKWAAFVFNIRDGELLSDEELQKKVCDAYDAEIEGLNQMLEDR